MGAAVAESVTLERFILREAGAKEVVIGLIHGAFLLLTYSFYQLLGALSNREFL